MIDLQAKLSVIDLKSALNFGLFTLKGMANECWTDSFCSDYGFSASHRIRKCIARYGGHRVHGVVIEPGIVLIRPDAVNAPQFNVEWLFTHKILLIVEGYGAVTPFLVLRRLAAVSDRPTAPTAAGSPHTGEPGRFGGNSGQQRAPSPIGGSNLRFWRKNAVFGFSRPCKQVSITTRLVPVGSSLLLCRKKPL